MATTFSIILLNLVVAEIFGIALCVLLFYYTLVRLKDGIGFDGYNANRNLHILIMPLGLVFLTGNSLVLYRFFRKTKTLRLKFVHSVIHTLCIVSSSFALSAIVDSKHEPRDDCVNDKSTNTANCPKTKFDDYASLHSWIGTITLIMLLFEYASGLIMYCMDCLPWEIEDNYAYMHAFFGICNFVLNSLTSVLGLLTMTGKDYSYVRSKLGCSFEKEGVPYLENFIGVFILLFTGYLLHILLNPYFKWERVF